MQPPVYLAERPAEINSAITIFENFCEKFHFKETNVTGTLNDLILLNYCEYETGYPDGDWVVGARIWANMVVSVGSAAWARGEGGELFLVSPLASDGYNRWSYEILPMFQHYQYNEYVQWGAVDTLTQFFMIHVLFGGGELSEIKGLLKLWRDRNELEGNEGDIFKFLQRTSKVLVRLT